MSLQKLGANIGFEKTRALITKYAPLSYWTWREWRTILDAALEEGWLPKITAELKARCARCYHAGMPPQQFWAMLFGTLPAPREDVEYDGSPMAQVQVLPLQNAADRSGETAS